MEPLAIIYPDPQNADKEVREAIKYALETPCAIAVRSGGHQYSGASSTFGKNIQLDVSDTYLTFELLDDVKTNERPLVRVGVGFPLVVLNEKLGELGLFVPHGQCSHVHVGGHAHTGGYGQLGRAFGLFADHIETIEVWTAKDVTEKGDEAKARVITRGSDDDDDRDLFYAVLGGSPGNYGILTHVTLKTRRDVDHPDSRGLKLVAMYNKEVRPKRHLK
jgi:FAD/FMN-containing dehydrogenase